MMIFSAVLRHWLVRFDGFGFGLASVPVRTKTRGNGRFPEPVFASRLLVNRPRAIGETRHLTPPRRSRQIVGIAIREFLDIEEHGSAAHRQFRLPDDMDFPLADGKRLQGLGVPFGPCGQALGMSMLTEGVASWGTVKMPSPLYLARLLGGQLPDVLTPGGFLLCGGPCRVFGARWDSPPGQEMALDGAGQERVQQTRCDHASPTIARLL